MIEELNSNDLYMKRYLSIDLFKGFSIILMTFVNTLRPYESIPVWSKHAVDYGLTYVDLIAPFFIFMLVLNTHLSYNKNLKFKGRKSALGRHLRRFLLFIIIGLIFSIDIDAGTLKLRWGTLQILGTSGLFLLAVIELKGTLRLVCSITCLIVHQSFLLNGLADAIYEGIEGGFFSIFSWSGMALLFSVFYDLIIIKKKKKITLLFGFIAIISGLISSVFWQISRQYVSISYVLVSVGISSILFNIFYDYLDSDENSKPFKIKGNFLLNLGKNAFFFILTSYYFDIYLF